MKNIFQYLKNSSQIIFLKEIYLDLLRVVFSKSFIERRVTILIIYTIPYAYYLYTVIIPERRQYQTFLIQKDVEERVVPTLQNLPQPSYDDYMMFRKYAITRDR